MKISLSQAMAWRKTLKERRDELVGLRDGNANKERRFYGSTSDVVVVKDPVYDVRKLDKLLTKVGNEMRKLDDAIKATNAVTMVAGYEQDDSVLGELE